MRLAGVRSFAVLRALRLGDMLAAVPALRALRGGLPQAHVTLIGLPWAEAFARRYRAWIDAFEPLPGWPGLAEQPPRPEAVPAFLRRMQAARFDLVLQMHGSGTVTNPLALLLGGRLTAGLYARGGWCPDPTSFFPVGDDEHEVRRLLRLVTSLGIPPRGEHAELPLEPADHDALRGVGLPGRGAYACVHPGASRPDKCWPAACFSRVADSLAQRGLRVVLTGMPAEQPLTRAVAEGMAHPALDLAGHALPLGPLAALLRDAAVLVSNDTGVAHVGTAVGVPRVVVFSAADPARWGPLDTERCRIVRGADASVATVVSAVDSLLGGT